MMKSMLVVMGLLVTALISFQIYSTMATTKSETQPYQILKTEKEYEIRYYPTATVATVAMAARTYKELSATGFRKLASFIFGGNQANKNIAMTKPVHMDINDSLSSMSFVMPAEYTKGNLPQPNDSAIKITAKLEEYVAAIRFDGYANDANIKMYTTKLKNALKEKGIEYYGNFRFLGYNAPYRFWSRRNEIIVSVRW